MSHETDKGWLKPILEKAAADQKDVPAWQRGEASEDAERREFEQFMRTEMSEFDLTPQFHTQMGTYAALDTEDCWRTWLARSHREAK